MITALIAALALSSVWIVYIAFFNSQVQGLLITWILRHLGYIRDAEVKFGSISISLIGGKIMFKELKFTSKDYAIRCVDGALIFKWFTRLSPDDISRESQTWSLYHIIFQSRALLTLYGLEVHIYNRTSLYDDLEKVDKCDLDVGVPEEAPDPQSPEEPQEAKEDKWGLRNLIPVLVVEVQKGKFVVGNNLTETVLFVDIDTATAIYSTPTKKHLDPYMHQLRSKISKIRITLNKSPGYKGLHETPPSQPEAGVPLLRSREVRLQYIQDVPGRVTNLQKSAESSPEWEMTVKFMKDTTLHYGPWLDRQRDILYQFFYPPDYKVAEVSKPLRVGDHRRHQSFNIIIDFEAKSTLSILFFREEQTSSLNLDIENGSRIQLQIPWTVTPQGFTTTGVADLYSVHCETSLDYRPFFEADEIHMIFHFQYPRVWHHLQTWGCDFFNVNRPVLHFVFDHVEFFTDLINDWSPAVQPDLLKFVPYVWNFNFKFNKALIILPVSQHNWVDCIEYRIENSETVFFGLHCETLDIEFTLPWNNFQPSTTELRFDINAEDISGSLWLPKYHTLRDSLKQFNMGKIPPWLYTFSDKMSEEANSSVKDKNLSPLDLEGWEECWSLQDLFLRFTFLNNSIVPYQRPGYKFTSEEKTNHLGIEVIIGPSVIRLYGLFFRHLWFFKDNYFGYDDKCTPLTYIYNRSFDKNKSTRIRRPEAECPIYDLDVTCKVIVKDLLGEFPRHCDTQNTQIKLPCVQIDQIEFELFKTSKEAIMELTVSPINMLFVDTCKRSARDSHLAHGFLQLQGVKVAMCGLYSGKGINNPKNPFDYLEYAFLVDVTAGALVGKVTVPHIQEFSYWLEIFLWQCLDRENEMPLTENQMGIERAHAASYKYDKIHSSTSAIRQYQEYRLKAGLQKEITTDDLKYLMIKVSVAHTDIYLMESGCACNLTTKSIRTALCNAHDETSTLGVTVVIQGAEVIQYVRLPQEDDKHEVDSRSHGNKHEIDSRSHWLQAGLLTIPPILCDVNKRLANPVQYKTEQQEFLKCHDKLNQKLLFLWLPEEYKGCGCVGGVSFNNTSLVEVNGFYFEPVVVPPNFCVSSQTSNTTPWKLGRGAAGSTQTDASSHTSHGSSVSSRVSEKRRHINEILVKEGFGGISPRPSVDRKTRSSGKRKGKLDGSHGDGGHGDGFTTFPPRGKKRDKQKTLSHYNDLLRNFSIKRNISRLSSKRKSKAGSETTENTDYLPTADSRLSIQPQPGTLHDTGKRSDKQSDNNMDKVEVDGKEDPGSINSSTPSICITSETPAAQPPVYSIDSIENASQQYESPAEDEERRHSKYSLPAQSPSAHRDPVTNAHKDPVYSSKSALSRSSSLESFHSAKSGWRTADNISSGNEDKESAVEHSEEEPVKGLSIPFPFPAAADSAHNNELIDIYRDHLPRASLVETRLSNSVVLNKPYSDLSGNLPHRISSFYSKRGSESCEKEPPVSPAIAQMLQLIKYTLLEFESEVAGSTSSVTSDNLFSTETVDSADSRTDPKLVKLRAIWEKKLKEKNRKEEVKESTDLSDSLGKVICIVEIIEPVDLFFSPFCLHAINKYVEIAEVFYRELHPAAAVNLVHSACAPTVLEIAIQHATAQKALLFSTHLQPVGMKKFDNSLERTVEERLNLELFLSIPSVSVRTLQGGGDLQWLGTETQLESARSRAGTTEASESYHGNQTPGDKTDDDGFTDHSERSDVSGAVRDSGDFGPSKIARLSLVKCVANNINVSFGYHQFEQQKSITSILSRQKSGLEVVPPGEYTQTAFKTSVGGIFGQFHVLHPLLSNHSDTFIPYSKSRFVTGHHFPDEFQKFSSKQTSVIFEFGAEKAEISGAALKRNLLVALPEPPEQQKPKSGKKEGEKDDVELFSLDRDSVDIELGKDKVLTNKSTVTPFKYRKLVSKASIHYHSGTDKVSNCSYQDDAQEPLISDEYSSSEDPEAIDPIDYKRLESDKGNDDESERTSMGAEVASSLSASSSAEYKDRSSVSGSITELWIQVATPSSNQTVGSHVFQPYSSLPHAVLSWSVPGSLLTQFLKQLAHTKLARVQSVIAALLAEALGQENQYEPPKYTTKYSRITIAAKTLKESAVIRLMNRLRYTLDKSSDAGALKHDLEQDFVPRRIMLERGVQAMLAAIEGNLMQTTDNLLDALSSYPSTYSQTPHTPTKEHSKEHPKEPRESPVNDKTPVYYLGKQDYGSIAALDKISIGKPHHEVQTEAKHRTHRQALMELLSSSDKAKLADKYFAMYRVLDLRLPKTDHVIHQLALRMTDVSVSAIDCHRDLKRADPVTPFFKAKHLSLEGALAPAYKEFSIPKPKGTYLRSGSRSSLQRNDSASSLFSRRSSLSTGSAGRAPRPPRRKKKKMLDLAMQNVQKSVKHVVKHLVISLDCSTCSTEINVELLRLSKAMADGMSNFTPHAFHPGLEMGSGPLSPETEPLRSADEQYLLAGCWDKMNEYVQLMFRGDFGQSPHGDERRTKLKLDSDILLYTESPDIPLSLSATWKLEEVEIVARIEGLHCKTTIKSICGTAAVLQNLYVEMNNSPNSDIMLEPLSPNGVCAALENAQLAVYFRETAAKEDIQLICMDVPELSAVYSFLPHVTRIQKLFIEVPVLKASVPKPIVKIQNLLMDSVSLVLHEIKNFDRYFQRKVQSIQRIHDLGHSHKSGDVDFNFVLREASLDLELLPSLSLKHELQDLHVQLAEGKGMSAELAIHHHELTLVAAELHTHLPLPQIFVRAEKVRKKDLAGMRTGLFEEEYRGVVEIKTIQIQLPTTMLNHVIFVQNAFLKEINEFLEAIDVIRHKVENTGPLQRSAQIPKPSHGIPFAFSMKLQGIDLLATTPTGLAVSFKTETINLEIKNRVVIEPVSINKDRQQIIERARMFIQTTITTDITLGTLADISPGDPNSLEEGMTKYLQFRATASLGNDEGIRENKLSASESFHATISSPQLFMLPGAFDKALLFYLNYKGAYEIFNDERHALNKEVLSATETFMSKINFPKAPPALPSTTQLKMTVKNLAVCLPIQNYSGTSTGGQDELISASQSDLPKLTAAGGALSISIRSADMKMSFGAAHVNKGSFSDFVIRFIDDFDERKWTENAAPRCSEREMNSIAIDTGRYKYLTNTETSKTENNDASAGKMFVNVSSDIKGVNINLNTNIISRLVSLYKTLTSLVDDFTDDDKIEADGSLTRAEDSTENYIASIARKVKTSDKPIDDDSRRILEKYLKEKDEEIKALKWAGAAPDEIRRKEEQAENVKKLWFKTYMSKSTVAGGKIERRESDKKKKPVSVEDKTAKSVKAADEQSMYSTRTSKSSKTRVVIGDEEPSTSSSSSQPISLEPPSLEFEMDLDIRLGNGKLTLHPVAKATDDSFRQNRRYGRPHFDNNLEYITENTEFLIPETNCKLHYSSTKITEKSAVQSGGLATATSSKHSAETSGTAGSEDSSKAIKTGTLYTCLTISSLNQDQVIRPCLLEFLDQLASGGKDVSSPTYQTGYVLTNPLLEEFEELFKERDAPSRRVLAEMKVSPAPSSEHSYTSRSVTTDTFPVDIILMLIIEPSTIKLSCQPHSRHECSLAVPRSHIVLSTKGTPSLSLLVAATGRKDIQITRDGTTSCWNIAGSMEECKLSLYHPLSQQHYSQARNLPAEVRNALSATISGADFAITRITTPKPLVEEEGTGASTNRQLIAHVTSMVDVGKIALTYDIKRMDEVDAFHSAWLSGNFIKKVLLLSRPVNAETTPPPSPQQTFSNLSRADRFYSITERPSPEKFYSLKRNMDPINEGNEEALPKNKSSVSVTTKSSEGKAAEVAETNLLLAINSREASLTTNLGHTLGRINISIQESKNTTSLCLKERHNEKRKIEIFIKKVFAESTAGLITGLMNFKNLSGIFDHSISPDYPPTHIIGVYCGVFESKLDYLSNCILRIRVTDFKTELHDKWREAEEEFDLEIGGSIAWETIQSMLNCNTAPNLVQIKNHLDDFIENQKKYSQRAYMRIFSQPTGQEIEKEKKMAPLKTYELEAQKLAHHWFWAVSPHFASDSLKTLLESGQFTKPLKLGGSLKLSGSQVAIAIFQGEKFRDDTWALFTLNKLSIGFDTLVEHTKKHHNDNAVSPITRQRTVICMGTLDTLTLDPPNNNIGSVEKCVRSTKLSPPDRSDSIERWLQYACTHDFAHGNPDKERPTRATIFGGGSVEFSTIFQLPEMKLNLTTDHVWDGENQGSPISIRSLHHLPIPTVHCKLKSHFRGSIGLATNAAHYFFLHDLAQRYTKKMEKYLESNIEIELGQVNKDEDETADSNKENARFAREFVCDEWELKPQLRLHGGGKVEFQVDWLLNKLGFKNPTVTIPKWIQRGPMDPLDYFISKLVKTLVFQQAEILQEVRSVKK